MVALSYQRVHAFELTQKLDRIVLEGIAKILHMNVTDKKTYSTVVTCNKTTIIHIIDYYPLVSNCLKFDNLSCLLNANQPLSFE